MSHGDDIWCPECDEPFNTATCPCCGWDEGREEAAARKRGTMTDLREVERLLSELVDSVNNVSEALRYLGEVDHAIYSMRRDYIPCHPWDTVGEWTCETCGAEYKAFADRNVYPNQCLACRKKET